MMQSGRTAFASSGRISGSGFASARMIGLAAIDTTMSAVTAPAAEQPSSTSAPCITSARVRAEVVCTYLCFDSSSLSSRRSWSTPFESQTKMLARFTPSSTIRFRQAIAAAPAPDTAIFTASIFLPTSSRPFSNAAVEMMAVPCWSSWKTGIFMRSRSFFSM